ncbi:hypothetical protein D3C76_561500 [compost metagenome]
MPSSLAQADRLVKCDFQDAWFNEIETIARALFGTTASTLPFFQEANAWALSHSPFDIPIKR